MARGEVEDAEGQPIYCYDLVMFNKTPSGAHDDRGMVTKAFHDNTIRVRCADGTMVVVKACDVTVVDRSAICRTTAVTSSSTNTDSSAGVVTGYTTALDLVRLSTGEVVARDVSPSEVQRDSELRLGDYVVMGSWLGQVVKVYLDIDVRFEDGAVCRVTQARTNLRTLDNDLSCGVFYLGQRVVGNNSSVFEENILRKATRWLKGRPNTRKEGIVAKVVVSSVLVYWLASSHLGTERTPLFQASAPPACQCNIQNLTLFSCSSDARLKHHVWVVGDRCDFRDVPHFRGRAVAGPYASSTGDDPNNSASVVAESLCVANTRTTVDVLWQDGTRQYDVPSTSLASLTVWNQHEFVPGERVIRRDRDDGPHLGIVQSFNFKDQTARVSWFQASKHGDDEETVSAYYLDVSSDHHLSYGSVVVLLRPANSSPSREDGEGEAQSGKEDLSWVGKIIDLCDGQYIQVKWGNGSTSKVLLHEIAVVKPQSIKEMLQEISDSRSMGWANAVTQAVIQLIGNVIAQGKRYMFRRSAAVSDGDVDDHAMEAAPAVVAESDARGSGSAQQGNTEAGANGGDDKFGFPHFDIQQSPPDHHYINNMAEQGTGGGTKWIKRVQKEWKILEDNLPDTMYVRAFEDRMDLLRVAMVGVSGTPYQDGLFFFDLQLPASSYPESPPLVNYRSFGLRLNPNLYESGTVCLSLLNTFGGEGAELWSPTTSTVLQVVVSIQGLVLTTQPYYNETGYVRQVGTPQGRRNELPYNENAYLLTLQTMLHLLRRPPAGFEAFVREHFRCRGQLVLRACEAYQKDGCTVGTLDSEARPTELSMERPCSGGFRLALGNVISRLHEAFKEIGADWCE